MLLKYSQLPKRSKLAASGKPQRSTGNAKAVNGKGKCHRKGVKSVASKRIRAIARREEVYALPVDPCDNSNDSGLGFDHHLDFQVPRTTQTSFTEQEYFWPEVEAKRQRVDIKLESDNANDDFTFPHTPRVVPPTSSTPTVSTARSGKAVPSGKGLKRGSQAGLASNAGFSRDGKVQLVILSQPEMQHRARYQTEGSRGAVKDRTGNGFPMVKLNGYNKPAILEVYIGTDQGREAPHMFYQACRVSGKNSTPCVEKSVNGTVLIEIEFDPAKDMTVMCDCVGILKERNVDVEHRFPEESTSRNKKKSTRCRMVFRTVITNSDNTLETLQVTSQPIICTQPPGVPEICKKSMVSCHSAGGLELFILGKNFLKDTRVIFSEGEINSEGYWEAAVQPDKEFLQQSHLVCTIPPYRSEDIKEPVLIKLSVVSSGRSSEAHTFVYTPLGTPPFQALPREPMVAARAALAQCVNQPAVPFQTRNLLLGIPLIQLGSQTTLSPPSFIQPEAHNKHEEEPLHPVMLMPPPPPAMLPGVRRPSQTMGTILEDHIELKREVPSPPSQNITPELSMSSQSPSMATIRQFVSSTPLPSLSVENYLSNIESTSTTSVTQVPVTSQKFDDSSLQSNDQISMLKNSIVVSMANEAQVASKLDAFVKSNSESQISPSREVQSSISGTSDGEMVLGSIGIPQQTSPLNLNTHEGIVAALSPPHLISMEREMAQTQSTMCEMLNDAPSQSQSLPMPSQILDDAIEPSNNLMLNTTFPTGDKIMVNVPENLNMNVGRLPDASAFPELPGSSTATTTTNSLLMKVVDDLSQPSQFSSSVIHSSMETTTESSPIQTSVMVPSRFISHEPVPELMNMQSANFLSSRPLPVEQKEVQNMSGLNPTSHFAPAIMNSMVTEQSQHMASPEAPGDQTSNSNLIVCKEEPFSGAGGLGMENHFSPPVMSIPTVENVKAISPGVDPTFSSEMVFSNVQKMPTVSSELSLGSSSFTEVSRGSDLKDRFVPSTFTQASMGQTEPAGQTSLMSDNTIMNSTSQRSKVVMESNSGNNAPISAQPFHPNCSMVGTFSSQTASQDAVGFVKVATTSSTTASTLAKEGGDGNKAATTAGPQVKKCEDGIPLPHELTNMSEHDLLSYINPSCFDTV